MGDWMAYAYPREEDKKNTYVVRHWFAYVQASLYVDEDNSVGLQA